MENQKPFPWIGLVVIALIVLVVLGFIWAGSKDKSVPGSNTYGTSTPVGDGLITGTTTATTSLTTATSTINKTTKNRMHTISIETTKGTIVFETYDVYAPNTVKNFIDLANKGFYTNIIFHRVIKDFMIQGGDPTGTGSGGPGYQFGDELNPNTESYKTGYIRGTVAMANAGPNTNGSQFFIMHKDVPLPNKYTIFGRVVKGMDVVDAIAATPTNEADRPLTDISIKKVTVAENK